MGGKDLKLAGKIHEDNCSLRSNANSCFSLGMLYFSGAYAQKKGERPSGKQLEKAAELHERACSLGNSQACGFFASMKLSGFGAPKDTEGAMSLFKRSCEENDAVACFKLGKVFLQDDKYELPGGRDASSAAKEMKKACDLGLPNGCQVLAVMNRKGDGVEKDAESFEKYKALTKKIIKQTGERLGVNVTS